MKSIVCPHCTYTHNCYCKSCVTETTRFCYYPVYFNDVDNTVDIKVYNYYATSNPYRMNNYKKMETVYTIQKEEYILGKFELILEPNHLLKHIL